MTFGNELAQRLAEASAEVAKWTEWERRATRREIREVDTEKAGQAATYAPPQQVA